MLYYFVLCALCVTKSFGIYLALKFELLLCMISYWNGNQTRSSLFFLCYKERISCLAGQQVSNCCHFILLNMLCSWNCIYDLPHTNNFWRCWTTFFLGSKRSAAVATPAPLLTLCFLWLKIGWILILFLLKLHAWFFLIENRLCWSWNLFHNLLTLEFKPVQFSWYKLFSCHYCLFTNHVIFPSSTNGSTTEEVHCWICSDET